MEHGTRFCGDKWSLFIQIPSERVCDYTFHPESQDEVSTLCHELFHVLGAPDLYHYTSSAVTPVGPWDLMGSGSAHMGAYMKWKYAGAKWITSIPEITTSGTYTLNPLTSLQTTVIKSFALFESEFFVMIRKEHTIRKCPTRLGATGIPYRHAKLGQ